MKANKTYCIFLLMIFFICVLNGCGSRKDIELKKNGSLPEYSFSKNSEWDCMQIELDGHVFLPYSSASVDLCDELIGYYYDDNSTLFVLSCKGMEQDEWIIDCSGNNGEKLNGHNIGMLYREISVTEIPDSICEDSEYAWNENMYRK